MKKILLEILEEYLNLYPEEVTRQEDFIRYLKESNEEQITDWNNFNGHIVAGGFIYSIKEKKLLVLYHKDLKMFLYPGGHVDKEDKSPLHAAIREIKEETGLHHFTLLKVSENELVPIDIDTQIISYNERLKLPEHFHFDFRYLFVVDSITKINMDAEELSRYKWISVEEFQTNTKFGWMIEKILPLLESNKIL